jgi:hypothetical protein
MKWRCHFLYPGHSWVHVIITQSHLLTPIFVFNFCLLNLYNHSRCIKSACRYGYFWYVFTPSRDNLEFDWHDINTKWNTVSTININWIIFFLSRVSNCLIEWVIFRFCHRVTSYFWWDCDICSVLDKHAEHLK